MRSVWSCLLALPFLACVSTPAASDDEAVQAAESALIGGHVASANEYQATVWVGMCTASKVGPRHFLLAAHCINDSNRAVPDNFTTLWMTPNNDGSNVRPLTVASAHIHPGWTECPNCGCDTWLCDMVDKPDVALVIVNEDTPDVPEAAIDDTPVAAGDPIVMTGYGCDNGTNRPSTSPGLKLHDGVAFDPLVYSSAEVAESYVVTRGIADDPASASLCPGDSGGPLYRQGRNRQLVVGINALLAYTNEAGISFANWHTRLDTQSSTGVYQWLKDLGANVESGSTCGDGVKNGAESDVDCGGTCAKCEDASTCSVNADCMSSTCTNGVCASLAPITPCSGICSNPTVATTRNYSSGNLGTDARCIEVPFSLVSATCGGFAANRTFSVNGTAVSCNGSNLTLPAARNGGYCFSASAGQNAWAWFTTW